MNAPGVKTAPENRAPNVIPATLWSRWSPSLRFAISTEVHVYAFAIAANVLLSFIPFAVMMLILTKNVMHSTAAHDGVLAVLRDALPSNQEFITGKLQGLARSKKSGFISLALLLFTSNGVLLPLEVALNRIWGIRRDRSYVMNQIVSLGLAFGCGALALLSVIATGEHLAFVTRFFGDGMFGKALAWLGMKLVAIPITISVLFILYYLLPNGKVPAKPMFRAAVFAGILIEIVKYIYMWSLPYINFEEAYGPFYVSVTLIFWAFICSLIMLVGAHASATPAATEGT